MVLGWYDTRSEPGWYRVRTWTVPGQYRFGDFSTGSVRYRCGNLGPGSVRYGTRSGMEQVGDLGTGTVRVHQFAVTVGSTVQACSPVQTTGKTTQSVPTRD
ncbi:UNVERIFIED_CONTAM: hypothetical protein FKN15_067045 [Acipenser sinensis]